MVKKIFTLCIIHQPPKILLGMKKEGFGVGHWNGFGGKVEQGETIEQAAKREVLEEAGIVVDTIVPCGILEFEFLNVPKILEVHVFKASAFKGEPAESNEMRPQWFEADKIPFHQMWSDDIHWLPLLLQGKKFKGRFLFDKPSTAEYQAKIIEHNLQKVE